MFSAQQKVITAGIVSYGILIASMVLNSYSINVPDWGLFLALIGGVYTLFNSKGAFPSSKVKRWGMVFFSLPLILFPMLVLFVMTMV